MMTPTTKTIDSANLPAFGAGIVQTRGEGVIIVMYMVEGAMPHGLVRYQIPRMHSQYW